MASNKTIPGSQSGDPSWPYGPPPDEAEAGEPTWKCPGGECECHPIDEKSQTVKHTLFFHDENGKRMPNARCRVFLKGSLVSKQDNAGGDGTIEVEIPEEAQTLAVEWAPEDVPLIGPFPFRRIYHVYISDDADEGVRQRLHNLGFGRPRSLEEKIEAFQEVYDLPVDGQVESVKGTLTDYHDNARLPPLVEKPIPGDPEGRTERKPDPPLSPDVRPPGQGCLAAVEKTRPKNCHFSYVVLDRQNEEPVKNEPFVIEFEGQTVHYGQTDGEGKFSHGDVEAGHYLFKIGESEMTIPSIDKEHKDRKIVLQNDIFLRGKGGRA